MLGAEELADARVAADLRAAVAELRSLAAADPALVGDTAGVLEALAAVQVREPSAVAGASLGAPAEVPAAAATNGSSLPSAPPAAPPPDGVLLADPLAIRARRFRAVFVCSLQDAEFPRRPEPEPFLSDEDRRGLARASGLVLPLHEDVLDRERSLFYAAVSRPEDVLFLSWRSSDEEGDPLSSLALPRGRPGAVHGRAVGRRAARRHARRRDVGAEGRADAARAAPRLRLRPRGGASRRRSRRPRIPPCWRRSPRARRSRARGIEAFAACGVRWLVEQVLQPERDRAGSRADAPRLARARGARADARAARASAPGTARLAPERLDAALEALRDALAEHVRAGGHGARHRVVLHGLAADLERYVRREAACGAGLEPDAARMALRRRGRTRTARCRSGAGRRRSAGRVDRIDVGPGGDARSCTTTRAAP